MAEAILNGENIRENETIKSHADWVEAWRDCYAITAENISDILHKEIAECFVQVLECAGVYKRNEAGMAAFKRFIEAL